MNDKAKLRYESKSKEIRAELKQWETEWQTDHNGNKPSRQDIKDNPEIARKYKKYNTIRDIISGKIPPPKRPDSSSSKPESQSNAKAEPGPEPRPIETPLKKISHVETPSKSRPHEDELMSTPAISRKLFSPVPITSLGPTPQRDGRVLGLFDLLVEKELGTPSKQDKSKPSVDLSEAAPGESAFATPRKKTVALCPDSTEKLGRTPMASSKRQMPNAYATPMKNRRASFEGKTPQPDSVSKLQFDTPAFLKRHSLPALDENAIFDDAAPLRLPRKPLVRGLSEIVASLRQVEEDALDDDLEALREAEGYDEPSNHYRAPSPTLSLGGSAPAGEVQTIPETQHQETQYRPALLGGFDDEAMYDSPVEDEVDRNGNRLPVFKKKGQKRTTRKVNIKPVRLNRPEKGVHSDNEDEVVPETQSFKRRIGPNDELPDSASEGEYNESKQAKKKVKTGASVKKAVRKVNELAHANFHRLKLRNHGAKGGPGYNSKFRRRR